LLLLVDTILNVQFTLHCLDHSRAAISIRPYEELFQKETEVTDG